ncbi:vomeronasal type-2 receptor 26-like [Rana temporaria]|uniref:vomeronasal type-2 receptor 26-like n=1 Tax=Rana temporaria TaxID=8407 RepID=UPI001AAC5254|nr:vomeronasal type-2 receptor 26-like [Rana temporaria]
MAFFFAIDEINKDPHLLPNITLGYHLFNTCGYNMKAIDSIMKILTGYKGRAPNYSCMEIRKVIGFVGDTNFPSTLAMAELLNIYQYPQINHRVTDPLLSDRDRFPNFYRTVQNSLVWYEMVVKILNIMGWNWVGIITSSDGTGETELRELRKEMISHGICIEFVTYLSLDVNINRQRMVAIKKSTTQVIVVCGHFIFTYITFFEELNALRQNITFILNESWNVLSYDEISLRKTFNGSIIPLHLLRYVPGLDVYMQNVHPSKRPADPLLEDIWLRRFHCLSSNKNKNKIFRSLGLLPNVSCTGAERMDNYYNNKNNPKYYFIYTAVYVLAHALNNIQLSGNTKYGLGQLNRYIRRVLYTSPSGEEIFLNDRGELPSKMLLTNIIYDDPRPGQFFYKAYVFATSKTLETAKKPEDLRGQLQWRDGKTPHAQCNDPCPPGYRKGPSGGIHACCYHCVPCSDGEISNVTDSEICHKCLDDHWPDERKVKCIPKTYDYLSYEVDILSQAFYIISVLCSAVTLYMLALFILFRDTPIVKANNRTVSFILLTSILLSFLCVFLFLGRPVDITCMLRQMSFGIFFSIAVSSVLAKTITVYIAFRASKPGSYWRKWVGEKISNSVVIICSSVQVLICVIWLSVSPPYQEYDMDSYPGKIIIQCNEGSVIGFYSVLGYMGFLAAVSFLLAFMVRTLPDSFNEAKYITFSMLVFCSVWIAMIPAYLSTRGKYMVAVEIFAILASSAGLLGCIFFPKFYIIIIKPERNSRKHILTKVKL